MDIDIIKYSGNIKHINKHKYKKPKKPRYTHDYVPYYFTSPTYNPNRQIRSAMRSQLSYWIKHNDNIDEIDIKRPHVQDTIPTWWDCVIGKKSIHYS
jgi:hypothetical protein